MAIVVRTQKSMLHSPVCPYPPTIVAIFPALPTELSRPVVYDFLGRMFTKYSVDVHPYQSSNRLN